MHEDNPVRGLALAVFEANGRLVSAGNTLTEPLGLTSAWWQVLGALRYSSEPLSAAGIARRMGLTRQAVQRVVDLLAERGLIRFEPNPQHRRAKLAVLTPAGRQAVEQAEASVATLDRAILEQIGVERIAQAASVLSEMSAIIAAAMEALRDPCAPDSPKPKRFQRGDAR